MKKGKNIIISLIVLFVVFVLSCPIFAITPIYRGKSEVRIEVDSQNKQDIFL